MRVLWDDETKTKLKNTVDVAKRFIKQHPTETIIIASTVVGLIGSGVKEVNKIQTRRAERFHTEREIYDPNTGSYIQIKHKMTSSDHLAYERLLKQGVGRAEALDMLNLL